MARSMSSWVRPAIDRARGPVSRAMVEQRSACWRIPSPWSWPSAVPRTHTGFFFVFLATAAEVMTVAPPPSVTRQQSKRWKGQEIHRDSW